MDYERYNKAREPILAHLKKLMYIFRIHYEWRDGEQVLDVGSGTGQITSQILQPVLPQRSHLTGIDLLQDNVDSSNQQYSNTRLDFKMADIESDLSLSSEWNHLAGTFDKIFSFYYFDKINSVEQAVENMFYLLKEDGETTLCYNCAHPFFTVATDLSRQSKWREITVNKKAHLFKYEEEEDFLWGVTRTLRHNDFETVNCEPITVKCKFQSMDDIMALCRVETPYLVTIPETLQEEYYRTVREKLVEMNLVKVLGTGEVSMKWTIVMVVAYKRTGYNWENDICL